MPFLYELTFLPELRTEEFPGSRGNYYRLADGTEITLHSQPVWCERCAKETHGEEIEPITEIDRRIALLAQVAAENDRETTTAEGPSKHHQLEVIAELKLRRDWRMQRSAPPKCLNCGSPAIVPLEVGKPVAIPGGSVQCDFVGMCSTSFNEWRFSSEGDLVEKGTPTYWRWLGETLR